MTKDYIDILKENIVQKDKCKPKKKNKKQKTKCKKKCNVNNANIKAIFDPENDGIKNEWLKRKLPVKSGNSAICDCIIVCNSGKVLIVEILCGSLTKKELESKIAQIDDCKEILETLKIPYNKAFLLYCKRDEKSLNKKVWKQKSDNLLREKIIPKPFEGKSIVLC